MFALVNAVISLVLGVIDGAAGLTDSAGGISPLNTLYSLAVLLPGIGVSIRRLHDTGRSGWWILLGFVICIGWIVLIIFYATPGDRGTNKYGPDPIGGSDGKVLI